MGISGVESSEGRGTTCSHPYIAAYHAHNTHNDLFVVNALHASFFQGGIGGLHSSLKARPHALHAPTYPRATHTPWHASIAGNTEGAQGEALREAYGKTQEGDIAGGTGG